MSRSRLLLLALGLALSAAAVFFLVRSIDLSQALQSLRHASPGWIAAGTLMMVGSYYLRALRWCELLSPRASPPVSRVFSAVMVGFLAINTLPARLGEVVRAYVLARREKIPTATVLGSLAVERILDLAMLGMFWAVTLLYAPVPEWFRWSGYITIAIGVAIGGVVWWLHATRGRSGSWGRHPLLSRLPASFRTAIASAIPAFGAGLLVVGRPALLARATLLSIATWVTSGTVFLFVGQSLGVALPFWSIFLLTFVVCVGISVPASPGFLGVMEGACVLGLSLVGLSGPKALAFALIYHVTQLIPPLVLGTYFVLRQHLTLEMVVPASGDGAEGRRKGR